MKLKIFFLACVFVLPVFQQASFAASDPKQEQKEETVSLESSANTLFWQGRFKDACEKCNLIVCQNNFSEKNLTLQAARPLLNLSQCEIILSQLSNVEKRLNKLASYLKSSSEAEAKIAYADCIQVLGEYWYKKEQWAKAINCYNQSLDFYTEKYGQDSPEQLASLSGLAVCYFKLNKLQEAKDYYTRIARLDFRVNGAKNSRFCSSLNKLATIESLAGETEKAQATAELAGSAFRTKDGRLLIAQYEQLFAEGKINKEQLEKAVACISKFVIGTMDVYKARQKFMTVMGIKSLDALTPRNWTRPQTFDNWLPPRQIDANTHHFMIINPLIEQKAILICLHGLGLHREAYDNFGKHMAERGFPTVAFDLMGFGSKALEKGDDKLDPKNCLEDIKGILKIFRRDNPGTPVFLIGESMGGAMALQTCAQNPELIDGLICSAPAGTRYGAVSDSLKIASSFLNDSKKSVDVGSMIVSKVTSNKDLQDKWTEDPKARLQLSSTELLRFQHFMDQNEDKAKEIKQLPVIVLQGLNDGLVKPKGTADIFSSLATPDKALIILGNQEHLIFEASSCPVWIIDSISSWMNARIAKAASNLQAAPQ